MKKQQTRTEKLALGGIFLKFETIFVCSCALCHVELALNLKHESAVHASMTTSAQGAGTCKEGKEAVLKRTRACIQIPSTHRKNQV